MSGLRRAGQVHSHMNNEWSRILKSLLRYSNPAVLPVILCIEQFFVPSLIPL